ncbi:MAG: MtrB/PioB family outer membrane beta-barrel protein [Acidobacteria bacterium]|nr:MtrB/PioB family outer membrane beta-barrel protein [Acidobacteriota bacterium]
MLIRPATRLLLCCGAWGLAALPASAQEHAGNAMNPGIASAVVERDPVGMGLAHVPRTPTGFLIPTPARSKEPRRTAGGWLYSAQVDFGALGTSGDDGNAKFKEYKDLSNGAYLDSFAMSLEKAGSAGYLEVLGGGIARTDQFLTVRTGKYNAWRLRGSFNETPHVFTTTYRSLWTGLGSDTLLLSGLTPGGGASAAAAQTAIQTTLANTATTELGLTRQKGILRLDLTLPANWKFYTSYTRERREGSRPFGLVFGGGGGGGNVEAPESIDMTTNDVVTGLTFARGLTNLNVQATASFFTGGIDTLTIQNPLFVTLNTITGVPASSFTQARYAMPPDNRYYNVRAELARSQPALAASRFTGLVSIARFQQNDDLLPWTAEPLTAGVINGVSAANRWNTTDALTRKTSGAEIDTTLVDLGWSLRPANALDVRAKVRYYDTNNSTEFFACNPLTGQWGRLINDGTGGAFATPNLTAGNNPAGTLATGYNGTGCDLARTIALGLVPAAGNVNIRNMPFEHRQLTARVAADYRWNRHHSLELAYERDAFHRAYRERDETWEHRIKATYVNRGFDYGTLRLAYEYGNRRGSEYVADPYEPFLSGSFGPLPSAPTSNVANWLHNIEQFRKFDLADRNQHTANARLNVALLPSVDAAVGLLARDAAFPSSLYGRADHQRQVSPNVDVTWQISNDASASAFASFQRSRMYQVGLQPNGCVLGNSYYFFSDGSIQTNATGIAPAAPAGTTLVATQLVLPSNWLSLCGNAAADSPLYPTSRAWNVTQRDRNNAAGLTYHNGFGRATLDLVYTRIRSRTAIDYGYNAAALAIPTAQAALAGSGWSDLVFDQHLADVDLLLRLTSRAGLHLIYRYERGRIQDWHYDGVAENPAPANNAVYLDNGPQHYKVHVGGVLFRLDL